jgi:pyrroloquinoline quinone biosynthesis protein B
MKFRPLHILLLGLFVFQTNCVNAQLKRSQIFIRDPYILADKKTSTYYMYSSSYNYRGMPGKRMGVTVYKSKDLENWDGPFAVFETGNGFWADTTHGCWAPEVQEYKGSYYLFVTFTNKKTLLQHSLKFRPDSVVTKRATVILKADNPMGPFKIFSPSAQTPPEWMALDGTLFMENSKPYMVFCHEWLQVNDGTLEMAELQADLSGFKSKPKRLFTATNAKWVTKLELNGGGYVTDGPAFYKNKKGQLIMLWSSFSKNGYAVGQAVSANGKLKGPWKQIDTPLFDGDGGHPSLFTTFDGRLIMSIHQPNKGNIRCHLFELKEDTAGLLYINKEIAINSKYAKGMELAVIGVAQDAGYPQIGCTQNCCKAFYNNEEPKKHVVSLAVINHQTQQYFLFEATPDIAAQLHTVQQYFNNGDSSFKYPAGVFLSHAHVGHYAGLMYFGREAAGAKRIPVYALPRMVDYLNNNGPWNQLVKFNNIALHEIQPFKKQEFNEQLAVEPLLVPHRDEYSETAGFIITGPSKKVLFIPDIDKWEKWNLKLDSLIKQVDIALLDATFFDGNELPGRDIQEIPHPLVKETMFLLSNLSAVEKSKVYFIHFNHTNPLLKKQSSQKEEVKQRGFQVAEEGMKWIL